MLDQTQASRNKAASGQILRVLLGKVTPYIMAVDKNWDMFKAWYSYNPKSTALLLQLLDNSHQKLLLLIMLRPLVVSDTNTVNQS